MQIKDFSKAKNFLPLYSLLGYQKENWEQFLKKDLKEIFEETFPVQDYTGKQFELDFIEFKIGKPKYKTEEEARFKEDTYEAPLRVTFSLRNLKTKTIIKQEVFLANLPLLTKNGTFIINGVEKVVISQLIRSPGVFFTARLFGGRKFFGAKIIPVRGVWLELETDLSGFIGVKINRQRKIAVTTLLQAFGCSRDFLKKEFKGLGKTEAKEIEKTLSRDSAANQEEALVEIYQKLRTGDLVSPDAARDFIYNMFFNFQRYDLGKVGRWKTWQRLPGLKPELKTKNETITKEDRVLKVKDILFTLKEIIRLNNTPGADPDYIDHLGNRRIKSLSEILESRIRVGIFRLKRIIQDKMSTLEPSILTPVQLINPKPVMSVIEVFFNTSHLCQFMEGENPLSSLEHKRRMTTTGQGGLNKERAGFEVRDVQASYYGRICPVETPEGENVGLISYLATYAKINPFGFLVTPYFRVKNGRVTSKIYYLSAFEEEMYKITHAGIPLAKNEKIIPQKVKVRIKGDLQLVKSKEVEFMDVSVNQPISITTSLIPFLQNDDARRALMGSNMQRQSVPLLLTEPPLVGTGLEENAARNSGEIIISDDNGVVEYIDASQIRIKTKDSKILNYFLKKYNRGNQYTSYHQTPIVKKGERVKNGQILTDGPSISQGRISLGKNILIAYLPFRGYTFEDSIVISERLVREDVFTSIYIKDYVCDVRETKLGPEITTCDISNVSEEKLKNLDEEGIIRVGAKIESNDILVGKISPSGEKTLTAEERLLKAIFGEKAKDVKDTSLRLGPVTKGKVIRIKVLSREKGDKLETGIIKRITVEVAQIRKIKIGDKIAGRHGNKGVVAKILPQEEMPFLADGTPVDIVLNPLGVISRMNIGQILEVHLGWAAKKLGYYAITPALVGANEEDIKEELKKAGLPESGKTTLYDGRTGEVFFEKVTVGYGYIMKLEHMVENKIHARSIGPYSLITQQPLQGRAQFGGQRFGEMEVWALEGYGAAHTLQEMLTIKSDDVLGRATTYETILKGEEIKKPNIPASFNLLVNELKSLGLSIEIKEKIEKDKKKNNS